MKVAMEAMMEETTAVAARGVRKAATQAARAGTMVAAVSRAGVRVGEGKAVDFGGGG